MKKLVIFAGMLALMGLSQDANAQTSGSCSTRQAETIRYVKLNGTGDGSSWENAAGNIQEMLNASDAGDQVWIASGTYPLTTVLVMKEGVNVYGGFFSDDTDINNRSKSDKDGNGTIEPWEFTNATILDGQNATRVLYQNASFEIETIWDGITITNGSSNDQSGGACIRANGKLNNCIVSKNKGNTNIAGISGGGVFNSGGTVNNCTVYGNSIYTSFTPRIAQAVYARGGGICNSGTVSNCMIFDNYCCCNSGRSFSEGGGIYNAGIVSNCCIYNNGAYATFTPGETRYSYGGGIYNDGTASNKAYVYNSTICHNQIGDVVNKLDRWIDRQYSDSNSNYNFAYNCITENANLEQNFIRPTSFVGEAGNDAQRAELLRANWRLKQGSQYIETGSLADLPDWITNGTDLAGNPRVSNGKISLGAYEFDPKANNAIKSTHFDNGIKVYPNPVSNYFVVDYEGFTQVKIYDMLGKEILSQDTNGKTEINVNHLQQGIYNVRIVSEGRIIGNSKIVKR